MVSNSQYPAARRAVLTLAHAPKGHNKHCLCLSHTLITEYPKPVHLTFGFKDTVPEVGPCSGTCCPRRWSEGLDSPTGLTTQKVYE